MKQAVDYAANKGIEWVILTNTVSWKVYKIIFSKPIQNILVCDLNFLQFKPKSQEDIAVLFSLSKEAIVKSSLDTLFTQKQATNKFMIGNLMLSESAINAVKKELKQMYPDIKVSSDEIAHVLTHEILKREILEGEGADDAKKKISRAVKKKEKIKSNNNPLNIMNVSIPEESLEN